MDPIIGIDLVLFLAIIVSICYKVGSLEERIDTLEKERKEVKDE